MQSQLLESSFVHDSFDLDIESSDSLKILEVVLVWAQYFLGTASTVQVRLEFGKS